MQPINPTQNSIPVTAYQFELFFEISPDLLCIAGYDGYFKRINPSVSLLLGYTNEELLSRPIDDFVYIADRHITKRARTDVTQSQPLLNFENRYVTKSGEIVWLEWTSKNIESEDLIFGIAKNITAKKKLEEERNLLLLNTTKINAELKELTYTASHDLRSPVNNLLAVFNILDIEKINDEETIEFIHVLKSAGESLKKILNDYVDILSEKESAYIKIEELDLNETLQSVLKSINSLVKNSGTTFQINFSALEKINFNKAYLYSIFLNLITNSIKYARANCKPVISISSKLVNGVSELTIADNCLGFDMEKIKDKIFGMHQKFHQHQDSKGIGLYLVHNHVTSLGGHITVQSKINEGTSFIITFKD